MHKGDFDLDEVLRVEARVKPKLKRRFSEAPEILTVAGLRKITYKFDGEVDTDIMFEGVFQNLSTEIVFLRTLRLVFKTPAVPNSESLKLLAWKEEVGKEDVFPRTMNLREIRLLGTEKRGLVVHFKELPKIGRKEGTPVSRLMQATREDGLITFEWVDINKRKGEEYK